MAAQPTRPIDAANTHYAFPAGLRPEFRSDLPDEFARLQGVWCGPWGSHIPQVVVIDRIKPDGLARFVYAFGDSVHGARQSRETAPNLRDGAPALDFPAGAVMFELTKYGELFGVYTEKESRRNQITMTRVLGPGGGDGVTVSPFRIPLPGANGSELGSALSLYSTVYRDVRRAAAPLVLISHGSAGGRLGPPVTWLYDAQARYFVQRGFTVAVLMRRGRGKSDGPFVEVGHEDSAAYCEMEVAAGVEDVFAALDALQARPWIAAGPVLLAGQSRGGFLSLVCAARRPDRVSGVVNFAGGWWDEHSDPEGFQAATLRDAGARLTVPTLWLYGTEDYFYGPDHVRRLHGGFADAGGAGDLRFFDGVDHDLIDHLHLWRPLVDDLLQSLS